MQSDTATAVAPVAADSAREASWSRVNADDAVAAAARDRAVRARLAALRRDAPDGFAALGDAFLTHQPAQALPDPYLVCASADALATLGFAPDAPAAPAFVEAFAGGGTAASTDASSGSTVAASTVAGGATPGGATAGGATADGASSRLPYASVYSGHQFGQWAGQLGDGRALSIGELDAADAQRYELQLKGSGMTPYSRMGDGRAVLRSSIREFLCSEAMDALGIPTTRALCVVGSALPVRREQIETAAVVTRFAASFVRFGHFEHFWSTGQYAALRALADHVIARFYPEIALAPDTTANPYLALLSAVGIRTANMIAKWQTVGFCHGVMNTDNMSILGLTIDYGPFGFIDGFDADHICNHTDTQGRYAFRSQPQVAYWNLLCLAQALLPLIAAPRAGDPQPDDGSAAASAAVAAAKAALEPYKTTYAARFVALMRAKLGLRRADAGDPSLIDRLLTLMHANRADFTLTFRRLANISLREDIAATPTADAPPSARDLFIDRAGFDAWAADYRARLRADSEDDGASLDAVDARRRAAMNRVNPQVVLRNHLAELAIRAARDGDFDVTRTLLAVLRRPFDAQPEQAGYAALPPDWATSLEVSCSS